MHAALGEELFHEDLGTTGHISDNPLLDRLLSMIVSPFELDLVTRVDLFGFASVSIALQVHEHLLHGFIEVISGLFGAASGVQNEKGLLLCAIDE